MKRFSISLTDTVLMFEDNCMIAPEHGDLYKSVISRVNPAPGTYERVSNWRDLVKNAKM
jgi:hypothetical protein